ncbi:MAG: outer membrane beta-barrel protein [Bacteroidales bacterium]
MKALFLTLTISLFLGCSSFAAENVTSGSGKITGTIKDKQSKQAVEYANLVLYNQGDSAIVAGTLSSNDGKFVLKDISDGSYYLVAYFIGYKKAVIEEVKINKTSRSLNLEPIEIEPVSKELSEVSISAERNDVEYKIDKKVVNVNQNLSNAGGSAVDALRNVPGVNVDNDGNVSVRGSSSFTVLIDGKPSVLDGNDALKQIPASSVDKIEVITNPSAKYDAEGTSGIINILMKKGTNIGFNGVVNASAGLRDKYTGDFLLNFKTKKINYYCGFNFRSTKNIQYTDTYKESDVQPDTISFLDSRTTREMIYRSYIAKAGFDYTLNSRNTLSFSAQTGRVDFDGHIDTKYHGWEQPEINPDFSLNKEHMDVMGDYYLGNLSYQKKFRKEGHELNALIMYSYWAGHRNESNNSFTTTGDWETLLSVPEMDKRLRNEDKTEARMKIDYTYPIDSLTRIEAGYQSNLKPINSAQRYEVFSYTDNQWVEIPAFHDELAFYNNIHALYSTYKGKFRDYEYQLGIRAEYTDRVLDQKVMHQRYDYSQTDFFPSASVSRQFTGDRQLQFSYSRRINRPNEQFLNPLPMYSDKYTSMRGNPELLPEFIDSYELNFMKRYKTAYYSVEAYYRQSKDAFNQMIHVDDKGDYYIDWGNIDHTYFFGADISGNIDVNRWFSFSPAVSLFGYKYVSGNITYDVPDLPVSMNARATLNFKINRTTRLQFNGFMNAPYYDVQGWQDYFYTCSLSARKEVLKKITAVVNFYNPFNIYQYHARNKDTNLYNTFHIWNEASVVVFSLSYKINNYKPIRRSEEGIDLNVN